MATPELSRTTSRPPVSRPTPGNLSGTVLVHDQVKLKSKERRKKDVPVITEDSIPDETSQKENKIKKRKREPQSTADEDIEVAPASEKKTKKKKLRLAAEAESNSATAPDDIVQHKKRKNKTGFPDPNEDASLPEQSQKYAPKQSGLAYAFLQFHRPKKWKFNKARQNWLIRNIWSSHLIPDTHLALVYGYLAKVQGGVRESLLLSCRTALDKSNVEEPSNDKAASTDTTAVSTAAPEAAIENAKETRARALMDILESSPATTS
ncbi:hypothetical protein H0H93_008386 [Arthromyces matolae]|nr:hypothetical protein H0H93_008386 [Arthromyces matolae]